MFPAPPSVQVYAQLRDIAIPATMASVEPTNRELLPNDATEGTWRGECGPSTTYEDPMEEASDSEMAEAARHLTSGMTQAQEEPEGSNETELDEGYTGGQGAVEMPRKGAYASSLQGHGQHGTAQGSPMSLADEARALGLCQDYLADDPFASGCIPTPPETLASDLADPPGIQSVELLVALGALSGSNMRERWIVDKDSAGFLASVLALGKDDSSPLRLQDACRSFVGIKVTKPMLRFDPELELQRLKRRNMATISARGISQITPNTEKGEDVEWASQDMDLSSRKDREVALAKLEVGRDVMVYLREIAEPQSLDHRKMIDALIQSDKVSRQSAAGRYFTNNKQVPQAVPLTPPFMPLSPPFSPPTLPQSMQDLELTSTPADLMAIEAAELGRRIMEVDETATATDGSSTNMQMAKATAIDASKIIGGFGTPVDSSSSPPARRKLQNLKADVPLLPQDFTEPPTKRAKTACFTQELQTLIRLPESEKSITDLEVADQDLDTLIHDVVMPFAKSALHQAEIEQLIEVDTTMRVTVPQLTVAAPSLPWKSYSRGGSAGQELRDQRGLMSFTKRELLKSETSWGGVSKLERILTWSPFPARLGKANLDEDFDDDQSSARYMAQLVYEENVDLQSLILKAEGLRLLDTHDSDDEEIEPTNSNNENVVSEAKATVANLPSSPPHGETEDRTVPTGRLDMQTLLQRRKLELEQTNRVNTSMHTHAEGAVPTDRYSQRASATAAGVQPFRVRDLLAEGGIAGFMQLHCEMPQGAHQSLAPRVIQNVRPTTPPAVILPPVITHALSTDAKPLPAPAIAFPERALQVVVAPHTMVNRTLVRQIQSLLPNVDLVERDSVLSMACKDRKTPRSMGSAEADMTISPMAGFIMTTLQKLKQKPLPGQTSFFGIRERIATVSSHFERLVVLVSEGRQSNANNNIDAQPLDERDCNTLSGLTGFAAGMDAEVEVKYVPGGEDELAVWIAATIAQRCVPTGDMTLLQEETLWERFLRSAGMNAFAAQVVLSKLKMPEGTPSIESSSTLQSSQSGVFGLAAFIRMSFEQRVQQFGPMLGGESVLGRVSRIIDGGWATTAALK